MPLLTYRFCLLPFDFTLLPFIDLKAQQDRIRTAIDKRIAAVLDHGHYILGPEVRELEEKLAAFVGTKHCIACASGTDALLMVLMAKGIGPGDAVFTTSFSFFATAEVIGLLQATPVFVDIDPGTYNIDPESLSAAISRVSSTGELTPRAILTVDLFGQAAGYTRLEALAEKHDLFLLEDGAQAFGALQGGKRCPGFGHAGTTSFFPAKPLGCYGDGGAVFTDDDGLAETLWSILVHGRNRDDKYNNIRLGLNARLDTLQAAILLEKFAIYEEEIEKRQVVADWYNKHLAGIPDLTLPFIREGNVSVYAQYCLRSPRRAAIQAALKEAAIPTAVYYPVPLHLQAAFVDLGYKAGDLPVSEKAAAQIFALPFHPYLDEATVETIGDVIRSV